MKAKNHKIFGSPFARIEGRSFSLRRVEFSFMKTFLDENFMLTNDTAVHLFHEFAKDLPIIDYHCHLSPKEIYENKQFNNITEAWLYGDHYKWRMMRANGVEEAKVTGEASDYERFLAWAGTVPMAIGNPLYHWSHMELRTYFGVHDIINEQNAPVIWEKRMRSWQRAVHAPEISLRIPK